MDNTSDSDSSSVRSNSSTRDGRESDPLFKALGEKKQGFRRNVVSLGSQEQSFTPETLTRQEAELKAREMEEEMRVLQLSLEERNGQLDA